MAVLNDPNHPTGDVGTGEQLPKGSQEKRTGMSSAELLIELRNQKLIDRELNGENTKAPEKEEGLAATIVKAALESQANASKEYKALADRNDVAAQEARRREDEAKKETNKIISDQINGALTSLEKMREEIKSGSTPANWIEQLKSLKELERALAPPPSSTASERSAVNTGEYAVQLEQLKMTHELALKKMDLEMAKMNQDLQIRLAEFTEKRTQQDREYEDSKRFRENAFSTVTDILGAASAGFAAKAGTVSASQNASQPPPASTVVKTAVPANPDISRPAEIKAGDKIIQGFNCKDCGTPIPVEQGAPSVTCPNPQCKVQYNLVPGT